MESKGNKVLLTVLGAATLLVAVVGATFAYFSAQGTSTEQTVTTGSSNITITASKNNVENIKPTTFAKDTADTNADIVKISLTMSGETTTAGKYTVSMNQPTITLKDIEGDTGVVGDIKYTVYNGNTEVVAPTGFTGTGTGSVDLVPDVSYAAGTITGTYTVYVWIDNKDSDQNNLQDISFGLTFKADATSNL